MNRVFGRKKAPGPPAPSLDEASGSVGNHMESMDGKSKVLHLCDATPCFNDYFTCFTEFSQNYETLSA